MTYPIDAQALVRLSDSVGDAPIYMLNLLKFEPHHGRQTYLEKYVPAFQRVASELGVTGIEPIWLGDVAQVVAGSDADQWDAVLIVRYPNIGSFRTVAFSDAYEREAAPFRKEAVQDWRLIAQTQMVISPEA